MARGDMARGAEVELRVLSWTGPWLRSTRSWALAASVVVVMWLLPYLGATVPDLTMLSTALTYVVVLLGLHVVFGLAGQVTLGPAAVFAIGAYGAGIADVRWHWSSG